MGEVQSITFDIGALIAVGFVSFLGGIIVTLTALNFIEKRAKVGGKEDKCISLRHE